MILECSRSAMVSSYVDGELSPEERASMAEHLKICAACGKELDDLKRLKITLAAVAADPGARRRVFDAVVGQVPRRQALMGRRLSIPLPVAAGVLLLLAASVFGNAYMGLRESGAGSQVSPVGPSSPAPGNHAVGSAQAPGQTVPAPNSTQLATIEDPGKAVRMSFAGTIVEYVPEIRYRLSADPRIYAGATISLNDKR